MYCCTFANALINLSNVLFYFFLLINLFFCLRRMLFNAQFEGKEIPSVNNNKLL